MDCRLAEQDATRAGETAGGGARGQGDSPTGSPTARAKEEDTSAAGRHETGGVTGVPWGGEEAEGMPNGTPAKFLERTQQSTDTGSTENVQIRPLRCLRGRAEN